MNNKIYRMPPSLVLLIMMCCFIGIVCFVAVKSSNAELKRKTATENQIYENGYKQACIDFYNGKLKMDLVENPDGTREWKQFSHDHKKRRGCIGQCDEFGQCKLTAWDDKNYFEGNRSAVIEQLQSWNGEDYYELKRVGCPKCGSYNIMENGQRGRMVITSFRCKDCGHVWKIKEQ